MSNQKKKPRLVGPAAGTVATSTLPRRRSRRIAGKPNGTIALANAVVEDILAFLPPEEIMRSRRVCKRWKDAAKKTIVPIPTDEFKVDNERNYNLMVAMSTAMPNLAQLWIGNVDHRTIYTDGEDPNRIRALRTSNFSLHPVVPFQDTMSRFRMLRSLCLHNTPLNGRYPCLFDFPLLESLTIRNCQYLKWDLEMLAGFPLLRELCVLGNGEGITGNINSLRALKNSLETVDTFIRPPPNITGNFMCLADFPRLKVLSLPDINLTGDVRDIGEDGFPVLEQLNLPKTVSGGDDFEFRHISEISAFMNAVNRIRRQRDEPIFNGYTWHLTNDSPDRYSRDHRVFIYPAPPFTIELVQAGSRKGWYWRNDDNRLEECCEVNWIDPEPDRDSIDYERYTEDLKTLEYGIYFFKGYHQPPTEREYRLLCEDRSRFRVIH